MDIYEKVNKIESREDLVDFWKNFVRFGKVRSRMGE